MGPGDFAIAERDIFQLREMRLIRILAVGHPTCYIGDDRVFQFNGKIMLLGSRFARAVPFELACGQSLAGGERLIEHGRGFVEHLGIAVEAGWTWLPPVDHTVLAEILSLESGDLALIQTDGTWEHIRSGDFVRAARSAVRLSLEVPADG